MFSRDEVILLILLLPRLLRLSGLPFNCCTHQHLSRSCQMLLGVGCEAPSRAEICVFKWQYKAAAW